MTGTIYIPLSADVEIAVRLEVAAREFDGIDTDPHTILRAPTLDELTASLGELIKSAKFKPTIDYPEA